MLYTCAPGLSVVFNSLNFLKPIHVQNVHLLPQYTTNNDVERGQVSKCKASIFFELEKFDGHWISRCQSYENIASMTSLGIVQKPAWLHQHSRYQWNFSLHRPFNTSCTVPSTSNLSRILVIVTLVGSGVPNSNHQRRWISTHSPLSNNTSVTTYVHLMIISRLCSFKQMNDERVVMLFQCPLDQKLYFCPILLLGNNVSKSVYTNLRHSVFRREQWRNSRA